MQCINDQGCGVTGELCDGCEDKDYANIGYLQSDVPDFEITIGIKDGKVIKVGWEQMNVFEGYEKDTIKKIMKRVTGYLSKAIMFMQGK